jgi:hypothetical protein
MSTQLKSGLRLLVADILIPDQLSCWNWGSEYERSDGVRVEEGRRNLRRARSVLGDP